MTKPVLLDSKEWLYKEYVSNGRSAYNIAKEVGCSNQTVLNKLMLYRLPLRHDRKSRTEKCTQSLLYKKYVEEKIPASKIAKFIGCCDRTVLNWIHYHGIPIRSISESKSGDMHHNWKGGIGSRNDYCPKFNDENFKSEVRSRFGNKCYLCGKNRADNHGRNMSIHHIDYNKNSICNGKIFAFVPLCLSCHMKTNHNRWHWFGLLNGYWARRDDINFSFDSTCEVFSYV